MAKLATTAAAKDNTKLTATTGSTASQESKDMLAKLLQQAGNSTYTERTEDERRQIAENRYATTYDAKARAAQQSYDTQALNYDQQMQTKRDDTEKSIANSNAQYLQNFNTSNRSMLSKGMQRSSYGAAVGAGILNAGAKAAQDIQDNAQKDIDNIAAQKTLAGNQLAQTLQGYESDKQNDILAYMDELASTDYDRSVAANNSATSIYQGLLSYLQNQDASDLAQKNFIKEFEQKYDVDYETGESLKKSGTGSSTTKNKRLAEKLGHFAVGDTASGVIGNILGTGSGSNDFTIAGVNSKKDNPFTGK